MINLSQQMRLGLKLTPQQVQYLKLLQLPTMALEQRIKTELEVNPLLETVEELEQDAEQTEPEETPAETPEEPKETAESDDSYSLEDYLNDDLAGYKSPELSRAQDEEEEYERPIASTVPMSERLLSQLRLQLDNDTDFLIAEEIIGNVDEDGYLRRDLELVVQDLNLTFGMEIPLAQAEQVIKKIQLLDPPGIAARNLQECLIAQVRVARVEATIKELALKVLQVHFEDLKLKRFENLCFGKMSDSAFRHDRNGDGPLDFLNYFGVRHACHSSSGPDVRRHALKRHDRYRACLLGYPCMLSIDDIHDDAAFEHLRQARFERKRTLGFHEYPHPDSNRRFTG